MQFKRIEFSNCPDIIHVEFSEIPRLAYKNIMTAFSQIGGIKIDRPEEDWSFPSFITSQVIGEIIRNTCFVCGGLMQDSTVQDEEISPAIKVRKCSSCGHSHT